MKEQKTIYAVVRFNPQPQEHGGFIVATKQSSNLEEMKEYKKEIANKYPHLKVALLPRARAYAEQRKYCAWAEKCEDERWERIFQRLVGNAKKCEPDYYTSRCGGIYDGSLNVATSLIWG